MPRGIETYGKSFAPVDPLTGVPLPLLPPAETPPFNMPHVANWHHHYHPSVSPRLTSKPAGLAIRHSRLQLVPVEQHRLYHHKFVAPERLPWGYAERFGHIVMACAGYIPEYAIDVYKDDPMEPVLIDNKTRHRLQTSGEIAVRGHTGISQFLKDYVVRQDLSHVNESLIEEFLFTKNEMRKKYLGHWLLAMATEKATEPLELTYRQARKEGLINPSNTTKLPNVVKARLNGRKTNPKVLRHLHKRLLLQDTYDLQTEVDRVQLAS